MALKFAKLPDHDILIDYGHQCNTSLFSFSGLATIAKGLDLSLLAPRKKINVLLIGNHSAGKSSFVNW